jgi:type IV secretion system protein VirB10
MTDEAPNPGPEALALDPKAPAPDAAPIWSDRARPAVAAPGRPRDALLAIGGAVLLGLLSLLWLGSRRASEAAPANTASRGYQAPPGTPQDVATLAQGRTISDSGPAFAITTPAVAGATPLAADLAPHSPAVLGASADDKLKAPALIVDLDQSPSSGEAAGTSLANAPVGPAAAASPPGGAGLNGDEQFARRVNGEAPDRAESTRIGNLKETIPQGAMIPGVLETALDSDLPGFTRAVVSRDVRGFDGSTILIPQGSRVIGEYKSAAAQGQTRAFIVWTRIIRPDGASIQIGSSGTDPLGRAGLAGSVNRHLIENYGGAILLSVIDAGIASLATVPSTQVVIGSAQNTGVGGASGLQPQTIPPTIRVRQGSPIRIFVARDLDFSPTGGTGR